MVPPPGMGHQGSSSGMRPPNRDSSSSQQQQFVKRPSSGLPQSSSSSSGGVGQQQQQQQVPTPGSQIPPPKERQPHLSANGQNKHDKAMMKIHPATIGVGGQQPDLLRKSHSSSSKHAMQQQQSGASSSSLSQPMPSSQGYSNSNQMQQQQQQLTPQKHRMSQQNMKHPKPATSFNLLDESIITPESLRVSPTDTKPKQTSIFSPDWKDTSSSSLLPPQPAPNNRTNPTGEFEIF